MTSRPAYLPFPCAKTDVPEPVSARTICVNDRVETSVELGYSGKSSGLRSGAAGEACCVVPPAHAASIAAAKHSMRTRLLIGPHGSRRTAAGPVRHLHDVARR